MGILSINNVARVELGVATIRLRNGNHLKSKWPAR